MGHRPLEDWLRQIEQRSPESRIELGLDRVEQVFDRLNLAKPIPLVATIAGTNGKGSVVAFLEAMALAAGHRTFAYTSPHLVHFSERFRIDGQQVSDSQVASALAAVEAARGDVFLSYFEHATLAGFVLASEAELDLWILEVGLGGRLDAVNVIDSDVAVITSIGLDHTDWLGPTRLHIGREKAGIARPGRPLIVGEKRPPRGFDGVLKASGARVFRSGREFHSRRSGDHFTLQWSGQTMKFPLPTMRGRWQQANAASAVMAALNVQERLPIDAGAIASGLQRACVAGRLQTVQTAPEVIVDVAHNPAAARALADYLETERVRPTVAVYSALGDKDVLGVARALKTAFDHWLVPPLDSDRARPNEEIAGLLRHAAVTGSVNTVESIDFAIAHARSIVGTQGRVVVFGSFRTVAEAWPLFDSH